MAVAPVDRHVKQLRARQRLGDAVDGTRIAIDRGDYRPAIRRAPFRSTRYSEQIELTRAAEWLELWPEAPEAADKKFSVGP